LKSGVALVIEVKAQIFISADYWQSRAPHIRKAYQCDHATEHLVVSERQIRIEPRLTNYKLMLRYGARETDPEADLLVRDALSRIPLGTCIGEVSDRVPLGQSRHARIYAATLRAALNGTIKLDLEKPLSPATAILEKPAYG
jgi:hypothetical protein